MIEGDTLNKILQSHLRSPVSSILSLAQLILLEGGSDPKIRDYAQSIYDRGQRLITEMDNLVDLDKIDKQVFELHREPLVLNSYVEQILNDYDRPMKLKGLSLDVWVQGRPWGSAPLVTYWGKGNLLWGILESALRNAFEAAPAGSTVELKIDLSGEFLILDLENEGEVPEELRGRFFEPFLTSKPEGAGVGTYVVRSFARALEGDASMVTGQGKTAIRVTLPQHEGSLDV